MINLLKLLVPNLAKQSATKLHFQEKSHTLRIQSWLKSFLIFFFLNKRAS